jgi:uncharacterized protein YbbC (DUF1343 family)
MVAAGVNVVLMFSPEHGIAGKEDKEHVEDTRDAATRIPVVSLYKDANRKPSTEMLKKVDVLVFDIQDIGARFYTYMCTMLNALEEAAKLKIAVVVLDRPNPITGTRVEGPVLEEEFSSFVGCYPLPLRHGMTLGEIARMVNAESNWGVDLDVVAMRGWRRTDWFDSTGLTWVNPSPNMRSLTAALVYPAVAMLEYSKNYSVGRGTESPFEHFGAPWINGRELAAYLNSREIAGVRFYPTRFQPSGATLAGETVEGVRIVVTQRDLVSSALLGLEIAAALEKLYPGKIDFALNRKLLANSAVIKALASGEDPRAILETLKEPLARFALIRRRYLFY